MHQDITLLNNEFAIDGQISFRELDNGFIIADIQNSNSTGSIALQGAHLLSWTPAAEKPVIWISGEAEFAKGKSIRGGIPICWPWFGAHTSQPSWPAHGFARTSLWQVSSTRSLENGDNSISLILNTTGNNPMWPWQCSCELTVRLGSELEIEITTTNNSHENITISQALHTYFAIGDIHQTSVHGLNGRPYLDKPEGFRRKQQFGPIIFNHEVDRVYLQTPDECLIEDQDTGRMISIEKSGSDSTIVWNPWADRAAEMGDLGENGYKSMLCVESANAAEDVVLILPGGTHTLAVRYHVEMIEK